MIAHDIFTHTHGRRITCRDTELYLEEIGNPDSPALILLHGGFGTVEDFNRITPALSSHFRLIGIDSRGHGNSGRGTAPLSYKTMEDDLAAIVEAINLDAFSILGLSDGGIVAYRYATRNDPRLQKVITVGASWRMDQQDPAWPMISSMNAALWKEMFPASVESYEQLNPEPDFDRFAEAVIAMWTDLGADGHPENRLSGLETPLLIARGDQDPLTTPKSLAQLKEITKESHFLNIPFAGHVAFDDVPDIFLSAFNKFMNIPYDHSERSVHHDGI